MAKYLCPLGISKLVNLISLDLSSSVNYDCFDPSTCIRKSLGRFEYPQKSNFNTLLANLSNLRELYFDGLDLSSTDEEWCMYLAKSVPQLQVLSLSHCSLTGPIQCLEGYLHCAVHACPTKWKDWLPLAEYWYNTSYHSSLNKTSFEVLYGHEPRHLGIDHITDCVIPDLDQWLQQRRFMEQLLQRHLIRGIVLNSGILKIAATFFNGYKAIAAL
jgi:hypothetical protein